jgi:hypothetical protein
MVSPSPPAASGGADGDNRVQEWSAARAVIDKFDGYQSDLRKYGFTLVTGLLSVAGLFSSTTSGTYPPSARFGVIVSILVLVVALSFLDSQYRYLQRGASIRARVLERSLNLDLTSAIATYLRAGRFESRYTALYTGFAVATWGVGVAILWTSPFLELLLLLVFVGAIVAILALQAGPVVGMSDWSVDRKVVPHGVPIRVTYTNLAASWTQQLASVAKPYRRVWSRRLKAKRAQLVLLPHGEISGREPDVADAHPRNPQLHAPLAERRVEFGYMAQAEWIWTPPVDKPGLYEVAGVSQIGFVEKGVLAKERFASTPYVLTIQVLPKDDRSAPAGEVPAKNNSAPRPNARRGPEGGEDVGDEDG